LDAFARAGISYQNSWYGWKILYFFCPKD